VIAAIVLMPADREARKIDLIGQASTSGETMTTGLHQETQWPADGNRALDALAPLQPIDGWGHSECTRFSGSSNVGSDLRTMRAKCRRFGKTRVEVADKIHRARTARANGVHMSPRFGIRRPLRCASR
jgi:hypothetical protein